jgi:hypothetical protein
MPGKPKLVMCRSWSKTEYSIVELRQLAKMLATDQPLSPTQRWAAAGYLRRLSMTPAALDALSGKHPGQPPSLLRDYKIALDLLATRERRPKAKAEAAVLEVAKAWGLARSTVMKAQASCGDAARRELRRLERAYRALPRAELLDLISAQLRSPENSPE